ncbi:DNA polymerase III subunit alpha [Sphingobacterium olei]|uniref:hypothetical protein n=1 Tax=Sphingobacterium olei TaxID=2571155 RepID=UPI00192E7453|nr:hypothetical protein [Sphingobacterium olei]
MERAIVHMDHVAFCGTNVEFKYRSIFREVGKVFGLPKEELDALATQSVDMHDDSSVVKLVHKYGRMLEKYPNQRSMHSCGILISEEPITDYSALEMPPKGFPIVQFDMYVAEEIGLEKFDILSQRGIGSINDAAKLIRKNRGIQVDIRDTALSKNEARCNDFLSRGQTIGCFYIESPAMRGLLRRLKCADYPTLVASSSIIRPGVAQSGMMKEYIFRHNCPDSFEYFHEVFEEHLGDTYGIMVYQEDVIKIAMHFGGLSAADIFFHLKCCFISLSALTFWQYLPHEPPFLHRLSCYYNHVYDPSLIYMPYVPQALDLPEKIQENILLSK